MTTAFTVAHMRDPKTLKPHPENERLYGTFDPDSDAATDLRESIEACGIQEALVITTDGTIISGHKRCAIALALDLSEVPVTATDTADDLDVLTLLLAHNARVPKSKPQIAREVALRMDIEKERARRRMSEGGKRKGEGVENLPPLETSKARDAAAKAAGVSGRTAEKMAAVVGEIDALKDKGETDKAQDLEDTLSKSVDAAYKKAKGKPVKLAPEPEPETDDDDDGNPFAYEADDTVEAAKPEVPKRRGVGIERACDAIKILRSIPRSDGLRSDGLKQVARWIELNK